MDRRSLHVDAPWLSCLVGAQGPLGRRAGAGSRPGSAPASLCRMAGARSYAEGLTAFRRLEAREQANPLLNPDCHSILLAHGQSTPRAVVLLHGITSSPPQFAELGQMLHARGHNVLIPRMPYHGYRDRLTPDQALLRQADFKAYARHAVDLGRGLGEHLSVVGLSVSGVLAGWCAETRSDVDRAVLIVASFAPFGVPRALVPSLSRLALRLPNLFVWWHPLRRARLGAACTYPRFSTHAMAASFLVGAEVGVARPRAREIVVVTNPRDPAVSNAATASVVRRWQALGAAHVRSYAFDVQLGALHDVIGPYEHGARVDLVYPILVELVEGGWPV